MLAPGAAGAETHFDAPRVHGDADDIDGESAESGVVSHIRDVARVAEVCTRTDEPKEDEAELQGECDAGRCTSTAGSDWRQAREGVGGRAMGVMQREVASVQ